MFGLLADQGVGCIPWSPLAAGKLTRPWGQQGTTRAKTDHTDDSRGTPLWYDSDQAIVEAVEQIALARDVPMAQVAMAWVLKNPVVRRGPHRRQHHPAARPGRKGRSRHPSYRRSPLRARNVTRPEVASGRLAVAGPCPEADLGLLRSSGRR